MATRASLSKSFSLWFITTLLITIIFATIYIVVQQTIRIGANGPQIQMAEDGAAGLLSGKSVQNVVPAETIDMEHSLAPYVIVFDNNRQAVASSAKLDNQIPTPPSGVFDYARVHGQDRLTWQPKNGVRSAIVMVHYDHGFVLAGRSLREIEKRENQLTSTVFAAWIASLLVIFVASFSHMLSHKKSLREKS